MAGRPKGGRLTDLERIESKKRYQEYQRNYRQTHKPKEVLLKSLISRSFKIIVNDIQNGVHTTLPGTQTTCETTCKKPLGEAV